MKTQIIFLFCLLLSSIGAMAQGDFVQYRYESGVVSSEGYMRSGKPDGYWKTYYLDGGLKTEGNRKDFLLDSTWKFYREDSTLERVINYRSELKNGSEQLYNKKGKLIEEYTNQNGIKNGKANFYYETGELHKNINFINGKEEGKATEFDKDGRIITLLTYKSGFIYSEERINRFDYEGKRTGVWRDLYPDGTVKEDGNWTRGLRNGVFKFFNKKGELDRLEKYEDGVLVVDEAATAILDIRQEYYEDGKVKSDGPYRQGKRQGNFREYDTSGKEIGGALYDNDVKVGEGRIDSLGRRVGKWKLFYPDGKERAEGEYIAGLKDGPWVFYFSNGKMEQQGVYKDDQPTGHWKWFFSDGSVHRDELYRKGKEDGHAVEYDSLGKVINEGDYANGAKTGLWKLTVNDHTEEGEYVDGERNGLWTWYYGNGKKAFLGEFQVGIPVGKHKYWYENGQLSMTGSYQGGEMDGRWDYYETTGVLYLHIDYEAGLVKRINGQKIKLPENKDEEN
jgi:uncharacterized protein